MDNYWRRQKATWQPTVPSWEMKFCNLVGSVRWRKLLETKRCMKLYDNVVQWKDSAVHDRELLSYTLIDYSEYHYLTKPNNQGTTNTEKIGPNRQMDNHKLMETVSAMDSFFGH
ncbi:hypothetical protein V6N13_141037 [Hibiscus sabdariffa]|uniref:Uncharacterized protein n=1 Tax=Hibiscus sabdariffa TaxID=183260 RepID=A0ABR2Q1P7_9ROSI